jgi:hypothetical protein
MKRPTPEVMERLAVPERPCETVDQWIQTLTCWLCENRFNKVMSNRLMHYLFDAHEMKKRGILTN